MQKALIMGGIDAGAQDAKRWIFTPAKHTTRGGQSPMMLEHGADNDFLFRQPASWAILDAGLLVTHWLDLTRPAEKAIFERVQDGVMYFSYGMGATPTATRAAVAAVAKHNQKAQPLTRPTASSLQISHISYTLRPAFSQKPASVTSVF